MIGHFTNLDPNMALNTSVIRRPDLCKESWSASSLEGLPEVKQPGVVSQGGAGQEEKHLPPHTLTGSTWGGVYQEENAPEETCHPKQQPERTAL